MADLKPSEDLCKKSSPHAPHSHLGISTFTVGWGSGAQDPHVLERKAVRTS